MSSSSTIHETCVQAVVATFSQRLIAPFCFLSIRKALEDWPTYGLVLTGHSLGGGAAALLSILWSCPTAYYDMHAASLPGLREGTVGQRTPFVTNFSSGLPAGRESVLISKPDGARSLIVAASFAGPIHCYTYGWCLHITAHDPKIHATNATLLFFAFSPSVASADLASHTKGLISSVVRASATLASSHLRNMISWINPQMYGLAPPQQRITTSCRHSA